MSVLAVLRTPCLSEVVQHDSGAEEPAHLAACAVCFASETDRMTIVVRFTDIPQSLNALQTQIEAMRRLFKNKHMFIKGPFTAGTNMQMPIVSFFTHRDDVSITFALVFFVKRV